MAFLELSEFTARSVMPDADIARIETKSPGWIAQKLASRTALMEARLSKRYDVPLQPPYPEVVKDWLTRIVTPDLYFYRGVNPSDEQFAALKADADEAWKEISEAADSNTGLYDLPLRADTTTTGITRGTPLVYSEQSSYTWTGVQAEIIRGGGH